MASYFPPVVLCEGCNCRLWSTRRDPEDTKATLADMHRAKCVPFLLLNLDAELVELLDSAA